MKLDYEKQRALGLGKGGPPTSGAVMRYAAGIVLRERERLARVFEANGMTAIAAAVRDTSLDDNVFKWNGPGIDLDRSPKSADEREQDKA